MIFVPQISNHKTAGESFFSKYAALLDILLRVSDLCIVAATAWCFYALWFGTFNMASPYRTSILLGVLLTLLVFPMLSVYRSWRGVSLVTEVLRVWLGWTCVFGVMLVLNWVLGITGLYSRVWMVGWFAGAAVLFGLNRWVARRTLGAIRSCGVDLRKVIIVGATHSAARIHETVYKNVSMGMDVVGYISTNFDQSSMGDLPCLGALNDFITKGTSQEYEQLWIALPMRAEKAIRQIINAVDKAPVTVRLVPDLFGYELLNQDATEIAGIPVITLQGSRVTGHARVIKAIEDRVLSALILICISPVMLILAIGVKLSSPGPIIFKQKRHGLNGKEVEVWKFRSMRVHEEQAGVITQAKRRDSRVTRFGQFIRSTSLDELPQFWNVLKGDMSIVGPRPHAVEHNYHYQKLVGGYIKRNHVKPGITGLAQIKGYRGETDTVEKMEKRIDYDLMYVRSWTLSLDLKIIIKTAVLAFVSKNAY